MGTFFAIVGSIISSVFWGWATQKIIDNKGYDTNWFWWGFFFGLIAFIVACARPRKSSNNYSTPKYGYNTSLFSDKPTERSSSGTHRTNMQGNGWRCTCGRVNAHYTGTCACGRTKDGRNPAAEARKRRAEQEAAQKQKEEQEAKVAQDETKKLNNLKMLKEYKDLLDSGIITQEEFDKKKAELL